MVIKIFGPGCEKCQLLTANVQKAAEDFGLNDVKIEKISDIEKIAEEGIMGTPALMVDNELKAAGRVSDVEELKKMFTEQRQENDISTDGGCSCGGGC